MRGSLWRVHCVAPDAEAAAAALSAFDGLASVSAFEVDPGGPWLVEALSVARPDAAALEVRLALVWGGAEPPALAVERVVPRDWLAENQASFVPLAVGRFYIHGTHVAVPAAASVPLAIDAATAFGTGEHGSTRGCLLAIDRLARRRRRPRRILDMGTGTGILAMAAAKTWRRRVVACDIDAEAVRVARRNAAVNGVGAAIAAHRAHSPAARVVRAGAPYDLVLANILARPLIAMARDLSRALAPRAVVVLAGLLPWQERAVLAAWRRVGLHLVARILVEGWSTLVLARSSRP